jgi:hypothetical protein
VLRGTSHHFRLYIGSISSSIYQRGDTTSAYIRSHHHLSTSTRLLTERKSFCGHYLMAAKGIHHPSFSSVPHSSSSDFEVPSLSFALLVPYRTTPSTLRVEGLVRFARMMDRCRRRAGKEWSWGRMQVGKMMRQAVGAERGTSIR